MQKVFVVKNVHVRPLAEVLAVFPATITFSSYERSSALGVSAPPAVMAAIEETIKRLDAPRPGFRNIELTAEVLEALPAPADATSLPPEVQGVVAQLKKTFSFAAYRLADTLFVRAREEEGLATNGTSANDFAGLGKLQYSLHVRTAFITATAGGPRKSWTEPRAAGGARPAKAGEARRDSIRTGSGASRRGSLGPRLVIYDRGRRRAPAFRSRKPS